MGIGMMMNSLRSTIINDSVYQTFLNPQNPISCQTPSHSLIPILLFLFIQCSLLHPQLAFKKPIRLIRFLLTPINFWLSLKISVDYCFKPYHQNGIFNFFFTCCGIHFSLKSLEWGLVNDPNQISKYHQTKPEFDLNDEQPLKKFKKNDDDDDSIENHTSQSDDHRFSLESWYIWTVDQFLSARGFQYGWGSRVKPNTRSAMDVLKRLVKVHFAHLAAVAYSVYIRDIGSTVKALESLGLPNILIFRILIEAISTFSFGIYIVTITDICYNYYTLFAYFITSTFNDSLPTWIKTSYNLKLFLPLYNSPHLPNSLTDLWAIRWHQLFRRSFIFLGGMPFSNLIKFMGFGKNLQKIAGLVGCFLVSGIMHELAIHFVARSPHPNPHYFFNLSGFPGSLLYFILQPLGMILESMILKYIPVPTIWVYLFTLISATPFRNQYFGHNRLLDGAYPPLAEWNLVSYLVPLGMIKYR